MKYISSLLNHFISVDDTAENLWNKLTLSTCEIDDLEERKIPEKVVIGYVTEVTKHPNADTLSICQIDCWSHGKFQILTGGENIVANKYVPAAIPGCFLPIPGLQIEPRKMRGEDSNGMICSKQEVWIQEDTDKHWIWLLDEDFDDLTKEDIGKPLAHKYPRLEGWILDIENKGITHRPDLTGHFGLAVEIRALYSPYVSKDSVIRYARLPHYIEQLQPTAIDHLLQHADRTNRKIVSQTNKLRSYVLLELRDISVQSSHLFTRLQLLDLWHTSKNNWVDFSNLFMYLTWQPVHFFDADKVAGDIIVREAKDGEVFLDLTGVEHKLSAGDIVIADKDKILALAGIIWGQSSAISDTTKNIIVEIANFDPIQVRKTATRLHIRTDAHSRFEKNINPLYTLGTLGMFLDMRNLYAKDLGNYSINGMQSYLSPDISMKLADPIVLDREYCANMMFGKSRDDMKQIGEHYLSMIWCTLQNTTAQAPVRRATTDVAIPQDLYEEVARLYGFNAIESQKMNFPLQYTPFAADVALARNVEEICTRDLRADQLETYPWIDNKHINTFAIDTSKLFSLQNSLSSEHVYMRDDMIYNLWEHAIKNNKFFDGFTIYDIGTCRTQQNQQDVDPQYGSAYMHQYRALGLLVYKKSVASWSQDPILTIKSHAQHISSTLWLSAIRFVGTEKNFFHPKKQAKILCRDVEIWYIGSLHPLLLKQNKMPEQWHVAYLYLYLEAMQQCMKEKKLDYGYSTLQDQWIDRDLCFVVDDTQDFGPILDAAKKTPNVSDISVFDVYQGKNVGEGKKSVAFTLHIHGDGTMTTEQINEIMNKVIKSIDKCGWILRKDV